MTSNVNTIFNDYLTAIADAKVIMKNAEETHSIAVNDADRACRAALDDATEMYEADKKRLLMKYKRVLKTAEATFVAQFRDVQDGDHWETTSDEMILLWANLKEMEVKRALQLKDSNHPYCHPTSACCYDCLHNGTGCKCKAIALKENPVDADKAKCMPNCKCPGSNCPFRVLHTEFDCCCKAFVLWKEIEAKRNGPPSAICELNCKCNYACAGEILHYGFGCCCIVTSFREMGSYCYIEDKQCWEFVHMDQPEWKQFRSTINNFDDIQSLYDMQLSYAYDEYIAKDVENQEKRDKDLEKAAKLKSDTIQQAKEVKDGDIERANAYKDKLHRSIRAQFK
jgi:hypothetical protein